MTSSIFSAGGVSQLIAGSGVTLSPSNGKGVVTVSSAGSVSGVTSFNTRTGIITLVKQDVVNALAYEPANLISPTFTGSPAAPTAAFGNSSTLLATTAFVQNAVVAATSGVASFNTRTGAVTLTQADVTTALGFTPANVNGASLTGVPTAPTATYGTNTTQLASTAFVQAAVSGSVAGVASFKAWSGGTPRTGAVTLVNTDIVSALAASAATSLIWNASVSGAVDAGNNSSLYIQRHANYSGGTAGQVNSAIYIQTYTPPSHSSFEWGITSEVFSYSNNVGGGGAEAVPQNVGVNGTIWKRGSAPCWGGNFVSYNQSGVFNSATGGVIGAEINVGGLGDDTWQNTIGAHIAAQTTAQETRANSTTYAQYKGVTPVTPNGYNYINYGASGTTAASPPTYPTTPGATVVDGTVTWTCVALTASLYSGIVISGGAASFKYGTRVIAGAGTSASFYSEATAPYGFGVQLAGSYAVGIDTSLATNSSGLAFRMKAGDGIGFDGNSQYQMKLNAGSGLLEFYNGSTRHGYINIGSGADVNFNTSGGGGGVTSFNGNTGAVTLSSGDVTSALGYTPAASGGVVDITSSQTIGGVKSFASQAIMSGGTRFDANGVFNAGATAFWNSGGGNVSFGSGRTNAFYLRIQVDGTNYWLQVYN